MKTFGFLATVGIFWPRSFRDFILAGAIDFYDVISFREGIGMKRFEDSLF